MKLTFLGAAHEVTGSCSLLEANGKKILIDFGMEQGSDAYENCAAPVQPCDIDFVLLTHAHIDHSGKIPMLAAGGFKGKIYSTEATFELCRIMLLDSAHIQESEAEWKNRKAKRSGEAQYVPPYNIKDVENTMALFVQCGYGREYDIADGIKISFADAGHLLGSASIYVAVSENGATKTILFSGDIGNVKRPLIRDPQKPAYADIVIIESTYGDRLHGERKDYLSQLTKIIQDTLDRKGNVVIPSFAVGRTQEMLYLINCIKKEGLIKNHPDFPVWVDSPLSVQATQIYRGDMIDYYDSETLEMIRQGINILNFKGLKLSVTSEESKAINSDETPKVIISSSGMCEAGRIRHHLKHNLWRSESTVLFVGYQSNGTLGRMITDGVKSVKIFGEEIKVLANIEQMDGISGHADKSMLLDWLGSLKNTPEMVFVNHGDDNVCDKFAADVKSQLGFNTEAPYNGSVYDLSTLECIDKGNMTRINKVKVQHSAKSSAAYELLLKAARRLMNLIGRKKNAPSKELAKITNQLNDFCKRWEK